MKFSRLNEIEIYLAQKQYASIEDLMAKFNVSLQTLRRDLSELQERKVITKIYGGAIYNKQNVQSVDTIDIQTRSKLNIEDKIHIGKIASQLVKNNDIIFIDSGSTALHIIPNLANLDNVTVVTHSLDVMNEISKFNNLDCILLGGKYQQKTNSFYSDTNSLNFNFGIAFVATVGMSLPRGLTNMNFFEAAIKSKVIENSSKVVVIADHSKFDVITFNNFCTFDKIGCVVTDQKPSDKYMNFFKRNNIQILF